MIVKVFLMGGIGNQLFQINRALSLKLEGQRVEIIYLGKFKKLIRFIINHPSHPDWININKLCKNLKLDIREVNIFDLIKLTYFFMLKKFHLYKYFDISLDRQISIRNEYDIGYFQKIIHSRPNCFNLIVISLIKQLNLKKIKDNNKKIIGFHIRTGDFLKDKNNLHINRKPNFDLIIYYLKKFTKERIFFFVITNNKKQFINYFSLANKSIIHSTNELDDFKKLIGCNEMYVSQSTYSFWAYIIAKKLNRCKVINFKDWIYFDLINDINFRYR